MSEAQVDGDDPLCQLRQRGLLPNAVAASTAATEEEGLRLEPAVVRPGVQIPSGYGDRGAAGARIGRPCRGERVGRAHLAQLGEARVVDQVIHERAARLNGGDAARVVLLGEDVFTAAAAEEGAPHARVAIELVVATLEIDQREQPEVLPEGQDVA